ncbi:anti sigma-E protein, RseA [Halopseudomonas litoralis]|uniref:Anti sigma-E protein, RseA n=1 Tax=Halopseudomonas litoralis TaxID=797277 RepID=A0A1H1LX85_9GAMM|nr:RseA family anti-sigma factor [Halopseudomonas litoralis]SDR79204.1 anti sigma-E protein, RseA [Halopseudomonas litoralis]
MRSESLRETLSALMDDEAEQLELRRVLHAGEQAPEVRRTWERYQHARSVMHNEPWQTGVDLSAGIAAALADEPTPAIAPSVNSARWKLQLGRVAVAATVTLAVLVGVRMVNQEAMPDSSNTMAAVERTAPAAGTPAMVSGQARAGAVLAGFSSLSDQTEQTQPSGPSAWQEQRIGNYLRRHAESSAQAAPQLVPYARAASLENN